MLLVYGYANADIVARVHRLLGDGDRATAERIDTLPGGMAANCACAAAWCGSEVVFFGNVGRDPFGELLLADFSAYGVNVDHVVRDEATTKAIVTVTAAGERAIISEETAFRPEKLAAFLDNQLDSQLGNQTEPGWLYVDGYHVGRAPLSLAKKRGLNLYCDLDGAPDTYDLGVILDALENIDVVQWNPKVKHALARQSDLDLPALERELYTRVATVITTNGARSITLNAHSEETTVDVPHTETVVDTTGAGDIFAGATLHYLGLGYSVLDAVDKSRYVAARSVGRSGARLAADAGRRR
ncbi:MAG: carbohydrate kinase family protein [Trueperaceae bacterium]|nr:carbohydrate kinase family protein [Trueperaceae bacterium]